MTVDVRTLADQVWALIHAIPFTPGTPPDGLLTFRNELVDDNGTPVEPPLDPDGRVHPYTVVYFSAGTATSDRMTPAPSRVPWTFQVSCVGGDDTRALWAITQIRNTLTGLAVGGGRLVEVNDTMRVDTNIQPPRTVRDLIYRLHARN